MGIDDRIITFQQFPDFNDAPVWRKLPQFINVSRKKLLELDDVEPIINPCIFG